MKKLLLILAVAAIAGCDSRMPVSTSQSTDNPQYEISELFTHNGITVYRFDDGREVYFTSRGDTSYNYTQSCGKNCTQTHQLQTLGDPYGHSESSPTESGR